MNLQITNGEGIIQLFFDESSSCLVIEKPLNVNWPDCRGSVGEYYALSKEPFLKSARLADALNQKLIAGSDEEVMVEIKSFLNLFENGDYQVFLKTINPGKSEFFNENQTEYSVHVPPNEQFSGAFYPYPFDRENYFFTNPESQMDQKRIKYYKKLLREGHRPRIVTYELYSYHNDEKTACYILDGNHKTKAYLDLGIDIPSIEITKLEQKSAQTAQLLKASSKILKDFEFEHLFINTEGIEQIPFVTDDYLTAKLDEILLNSQNPGTEIVKLFIRMNNSTSVQDLEWLQKRLEILSQNKTMGKGLYLRYFIQREDLKYGCWTFDKINNREEFERWKKSTLPQMT